MSAARSREAFEQEEAERLAPWGARAGGSRGRVTEEPAHPYRTAFQRDRDRIVHTTAFRRLEYKTQVFVPHEGDHYRTRLTHTIEAAQIARSMARMLRCNEDLAEAVALAHDLGHTPFGHAGERVLDELMGDDGGFDHNRQTLRIVDWLEDRYPDFRGLNLSEETREGLLKHGAPWPHPVRLPELAAQRTVEAQLADRADEIAYTNHDLDDGLRSGLLTLEALDESPLWREVRGEVEALMPDAPGRIWQARTVGSLINRLVTDLVESTAGRLEALAPRDVEALRAHSEPVVSLSEGLAGPFADLKRYLFEHLYDHPAVVANNRESARILGDLHAAFRRRPEVLPSHVRERFAEEGEARAVADYIAGMTDRFACSEHERLTS